jgi:hypothetical protein
MTSAKMSLRALFAKSRFWIPPTSGIHRAEQSVGWTKDSLLRRFLPDSGRLMRQAGAPRNDSVGLADEFKSMMMCSKLVFELILEDFSRFLVVENKADFLEGGSFDHELDSHLNHHARTVKHRKTSHAGPQRRQ